MYVNVWLQLYKYSQSEWGTGVRNESSGGIRNSKFEFCEVSVVDGEKWLLTINNDKPPGIDNLDGKLMRMVADSIATPICHF